MYQAADIGSFDRKVSFQACTSGKTASGGVQKTYAHSFYMNMSREQLSGEETFLNSRVMLPTRYRYCGHYKAAVNETMQIVDDAIKYNIVSVNPLKGRVFMEVIAERITE